MQQSKSSVEYERRRQEFISLVQWLKRTPNGSRLLDIMKQRYIDPQLFDKDPLIMARNVGQYDLVNELLRIAGETNAD